MKISKMLKWIDFVTFMNAIFGMLAIFFSIKQAFTAAAFFILISVFFDWIDGKIARAKNLENRFGKEIDSLADIVSFGVAPAVFGFNLIEAFSPIKNNAATILILLFFVCCGIVRLARFNVSKTKHYEGVAITLNGLVFPILYFVIPKNYIFVLIFFYLMAGILMISSIKIKKVI